jgi:hypothetical protein
MLKSRHFQLFTHAAPHRLLPAVCAAQEHPTYMDFPCFNSSRIFPMILTASSVDLAADPIS